MIFLRSLPHARIAALGRHILPSLQTSKLTFGALSFQSQHADDAEADWFADHPSAPISPSKASNCAVNDVSEAATEKIGDLVTTLVTSPREMLRKNDIVQNTLKKMNTQDTIIMDADPYYAPLPLNQFCLKVLALIPESKREEAVLEKGKTKNTGTKKESNESHWISLSVLEKKVRWLAQGWHRRYGPLRQVLSSFPDLVEVNDEMDAVRRRKRSVSTVTSDSKPRNHYQSGTTEDNREEDIDFLLDSTFVDRLRRQYSNDARYPFLHSLSLPADPSSTQPVIDQFQLLPLALLVTEICPHIPPLGISVAELESVVDWSNTYYYSRAQNLDGRGAAGGYGPQLLPHLLFYATSSSSSQSAAPTTAPENNAFLRLSPIAGSTTEAVCVRWAIDNPGTILWRQTSVGKVTPLKGRWPKVIPSQLQMLPQDPVPSEGFDENEKITADSFPSKNHHPEAAAGKSLSLDPQLTKVWLPCNTKSVPPAQNIGESEVISSNKIEEEEEIEDEDSLVLGDLPSADDVAIPSSSTDLPNAPQKKPSSSSSSTRKLHHHEKESSGTVPNHASSVPRSSTSPPICRQFQNGKCFRRNCKYQHICLPSSESPLDPQSGSDGKEFNERNLKSNTLFIVFPLTATVRELRAAIQPLASAGYEGAQVVGLRLCFPHRLRSRLRGSVSLADVVGVDSITSGDAASQYSSGTAGQRQAGANSFGFIEYQNAATAKLHMQQRQHYQGKRTILTVSFARNPSVFRKDRSRPQAKDDNDQAENTLPSFFSGDLRAEDLLIFQQEQHGTKDIEQELQFVGDKTIAEVFDEVWLLDEETKRKNSPRPGRHDVHSGKGDTNSRLVHSEASTLRILSKQSAAVSLSSSEPSVDAEIPPKVSLPIEKKQTPSPRMSSALPWQEPKSTAPKSTPMRCGPLNNNAEDLIEEKEQDFPCTKFEEDLLEDGDNEVTLKVPSQLQEEEMETNQSSASSSRPKSFLVRLQEAEANAQEALAAEGYLKSRIKYLEENLRDERAARAQAEAITLHVEQSQRTLLQHFCVKEMFTEVAKGCLQAHTGKQLQGKHQKMENIGGKKSNHGRHSKKKTIKELGVTSLSSEEKTTSFTGESEEVLTERNYFRQAGISLSLTLDGLRHEGKDLKAALQKVNEMSVRCSNVLAQADTALETLSLWSQIRPPVEASSGAPSSFSSSLEPISSGCQQVKESLTKQELETVELNALKSECRSPTQQQQAADGQTTLLMSKYPAVETETSNNHPVLI